MNTMTRQIILLKRADQPIRMYPKYRNEFWRARWELYVFGWQVDFGYSDDAWTFKKDWL